MLKKKGVFKVGHTLEAKTKGVWIYSEECFIISKPSGDNTSRQNSRPLFLRLRRTRQLQE